MADPTQPVRDAIASGFKSIIPSSSPLAGSLKKAEQEEAMAKSNAEFAAEAPVATPKEATQREPAQAMSFVPQEGRQPTPTANIVAQGPAQAFDFDVNVPADARAGLNEQRKAFQQESEIYKNQAAEIAKAEAQFNKDSEQEIELQQKQKDLETQIANDVDERSRMRLEPKNFFAGKATWQKIMGGVGLFLSSFSKEGAARFAEAVDRDIELDLKAQESMINSKDKEISDKNTLFKDYVSRYQDARAARFMAKADALNMIKLRTESMASGTKSQAAAGQARQAIGMLELEIQKNKAAAQQLLAKKMQDSATKNRGLMVSVPGFEGMAPSEKEAQEFRATAADALSVSESVQELKELGKKGSKISLEDQARANTVAKFLGAAIRTTVIGQGAVSEGERELIEEVAANPLKITKLTSQQIASLETVQRKVNMALSNKAKVLGISPIVIGQKKGAM